MNRVKSDGSVKIGEKYDSNDLPSALSVYWGFWKDVDADEGSARFQSLGGSVGGMRDFEIRFYASHADAVKYGTKFAINATGPRVATPTGLNAARLKRLMVKEQLLKP